jgi:NADH-quinone oxidoreductase subunit A
MENIAFLPPVAFLIVFILTILLLGFSRSIAFVNKKASPDSKKPYACGENVLRHRYRPDYKQFFAFAFFFTIMHVTALIIACLPRETISSMSLAILYILGAVTALFILFRS